VKLNLFLSLLGLLLAGGALAQEDVGKPAAPERPASAKNKNDLPLTAEREAAVMAFVQQNHAELKELLNHLRDNRRQDYERAIRELSRDADRIGQWKARDGKQYGLEIQAWTIKSRIQLLTAHLAMGDKEEIRNQLKSLLNEQIDVRTALAKHERARVMERLAKMDQEITRLDNERQKIVENQLQVLTKSAADSKNKVKVTKSGPRPGNKKPTKPTVNQPDK
jgi:hypothetical protein